MNPEQTALGPYCLQFKLPKTISRREEQTTKVVTGGKRFKLMELKKLVLWMQSESTANI